MIDVFIPCVPPKTSHHAKRIVRRGRFARLADSEKLNDAKATLDGLLLPHQPSAPLLGPASLSVEFTWPWLAGDPKRIRGSGRVFHARRPDCSNLLKTIEDRLVVLRFLEDDGQVVHVVAAKYRGDRPGIRITLASAA